MGLIHSRASKQRDRAQADLYRAETARIRKEEADARPLWRQRTIGAMIGQWLQRRHQ